MKSIVGTALLLSSTAFGSWSQEYCSNGEGTVNWNSGNDKNLLQITSRNPTEDTKINLDQYMVNIRESTSTTLKHLVRNTCKEGDQYGDVYTTNVYAKEILIGYNDLSLFPGNVVGVEQGGKYVRAYVICEGQSKTTVACKP